ncbi:unnamed protein product [Sphagnum troendelagicum]|uniref:Uncharacterized protein n=1 Tax=Sphagnum troendelagicum TaxID=128251 RepID=A0ABP0UBF0_9BRYO
MQVKGRAAEAEHQNSSSNNNNNNDMEVDGDRWKEQKTTHGQLAAHAIIPIVCCRGYHEGRRKVLQFISLLHDKRMAAKECSSFLHHEEYMTLQGLGSSVQSR